MSEPKSPASSAGADLKPITPAERISQLNEIDASVSKLLSAASQTIGILANQPDDNDGPTDLESAQTRFTSAASLYFSTLSSIEVRLRRQVYALDEAGLVDAGRERDVKDARDQTSLRRTAGGPLDPSWLNARAGDAVERAVEKDVIARARDFLRKHNCPTDADT